VARAEAAAVAVSEAQDDAILNPLDDFAPRVEAAVREAEAAYGDGASAWTGSAVSDEKRRLLRASLDDLAIELTRRQLDAVSRDAFAGFQSELAVLIATSERYDRAARRLRARTGRRFGRAASAAVPRCVAAERTAALRREASDALGTLMSAEVQAHEAEAAELPPRETDDKPAVWWKQLLAQLLGIGLNLGQAYLLQYLPAVRKDRADEKAMPRAPLF